MKYQPRHSRGANMNLCEEREKIPSASHVRQDVKGFLSSTSLLDSKFCCLAWSQFDMTEDTHDQNLASFNAAEMNTGLINFARHFSLSQYLCILCILAVFDGYVTQEEHDQGHLAPTPHTSASDSYLSSASSGNAHRTSPLWPLLICSSESADCTSDRSQTMAVQVSMYNMKGSFSSVTARLG